MTLQGWAWARRQPDGVGRSRTPADKKTLRGYRIIPDVEALPQPRQVSAWTVSILSFLATTMPNSASSPRRRLPIASDSVL